MKKHNASGPRIFYLCARRAGPISEWGEWLARAQSLGCDWLWLGGIQPRAAEAHAFAIDEPGGLARETMPKGKAQLARFIATAHQSGMKLATDFAPGFVARTSPLVAKHPGWFVAGPHGSPAVPEGLGDTELAATLAICDFSGPTRTALEKYWSDVAGTLLGYGFDALICRAAQRLASESWTNVLAPARHERTAAVFWADTLGAPIEVSEALAPVGFDAFFSSACWWDFHADWFIEQEARLRRMAPTIAFATPPNEEAAAGEAGFRYGFAATIAWGAVTGIGTRDPGPGTRAQAAIAAINTLKRETPALNEPSRIERLSAPGARVVVLAVRPVANDAAPVLIALNPDPAVSAEVACGPLFTALDARVAAARELTPGHSRQRLDAASRLAMEPASLRWFELEAPELDARTPSVSREPVDVREGPIAIERIAPRLEEGRFAVKRVLGETVAVLADLIVEGHEALAAALRYRACGEEDWREASFVFFDNDRWQGEFVPDRIGRWEYQILAWRARFGSWRADTIKRRDAGQVLASELGEGEALLAEAAASAQHGRAELEALQTRLGGHGEDVSARADLLLADSTVELVAAALPHVGQSASPVGSVLVERGRARTGAWYECFPRSLGSPGRQGTFDDLIRHLPYIAGLGFDVLYLPPIHPIGRVNRKGKNNALVAGKHDPGSPWAIGAKEGGHDTIHPELGTFDDFRRLLVAARLEGLEVALDFAIQCAPDHPWVAAHPEWFRRRPDGSIRYAENPPKKYEDIVNVDFFCEDSEALWQALLDVLMFWCGEGVRIFRVDNPHTKPLPFWEWALGEVRGKFPDAIFLAEAFTRPKLMHRLAKLGFSQSYTYFTWRETKAELVEYLSELTSGDAPEYFRPNFWVNTPDINPFYLHDGARAGFVIRAVLAATLSPSWGLYSGYELCESEPLRNADGSAREEYLDAEKYELRRRDFDAPGNIRAEIAALNRIRRENPAFSELANLRFHPALNDRMLFFSKVVADNTIWVLVSLDPHHTQEAEIELPLETLAAGEDSRLAVEALFHEGERWEWCGRRQRVRLAPERPAMILRVAGD